MIKFLRSVFCLPESTSKGDKEGVRRVQQQGPADSVIFGAQGPSRELIEAVHENGPSRIILCDERKLTFDSVEFERCNNVYWFRGKYGNRDVTVKKKPKTKRLEVAREVNLLENIDQHENVMRYWCHMEYGDNCYIVTDYGIALQQYVDEHRSMEPKNTFQQLCSAVAFLHGMKILLLNINPKNVRVVEVNPIVRIKLTNFESSIQLEHNNAINIGAKVDRCYEFAAPEIKDGATFSSDIYSLGCLFYFVITEGNVLKCPSNKSLNARLEVLVNSNKTSDMVSFVDAIRDMVKFNSNERPNIIKILEHPCFWREHEFFELIMGVCRALENKAERKKIRKAIDQNLEYQKIVIGKNWKSKVRLDDSSLTYSGNGTSICDLVKFIRNNYAHRNDANLRKTKAELMTDWLDKFPYLMVYLYKVKCMFNIK